MSQQVKCLAYFSEMLSLRDISHCVRDFCEIPYGEFQSAMKLYMCTFCTQYSALAKHCFQQNYTDS